MANEHSTLSPERWAEFSLDQQILMIGNEMNRAAKQLVSGNQGHLSKAYERILNLTDLTIRVQKRSSFLREILRWRDLIAALYISEEPDIGDHNDAFRVLLLFTPVAAEQIPYVIPDSS